MSERIVHPSNDKESTQIAVAWAIVDATLRAGDKRSSEDLAKEVAAVLKVLLKPSDDQGPHLDVA